MQAVILAGGKGTRLASRLDGRPKPLVMVDGQPLLQRQIELLRDQGVSEVVVLVNHEAGQIRDFLTENKGFDVEVQVMDDGEPRGTAGATLACLDLLRDEFLVVYGDTLFDVDLRRLVEFHRGAGADATLFVHPNDHPADSDLVEVDEEDRVLAFHGYPHPPGARLGNLVNAALYVVRREALAGYESRPGVIIDFAKDLFPQMVAAGRRIMAYRSFEYIKDLGTPSRLDRVEADFRSGKVARSRLDHPQSAVFLDRDGALNELRGFIRSPESLELLPGAGAAVRRLNRQGLRTAVITNQPVIARGEVTREGLRRIHAKLESDLGDEGAFVDRLYYCPHHPDAGFEGEVAELKIACDCRKPEVGLLYLAARDLNVDPALSWFVGDSTADLVAAARFGCASILVETGEAGRDGKYVARPDFVAADLAAAVALILDEAPPLLEALQGAAHALPPGALVLVDDGAETAPSRVASALRLLLRRGGRAAHALASPALAAPGLVPWLGGGAARFAAPAYDRKRAAWGESDVEAGVGAGDIVIVEGCAGAAPPGAGRPMFRLGLNPPRLSWDSGALAIDLPAPRAARPGAAA